jgi:hypothetical protein
MLDIPSISAIVAAVGVLIGVVLTVLELRNLVEQRQVDVLWRIFQTVNSGEFLDAMPKAWSMALSDFEEFTRKYGDLSSENNPAAKPITMIATFFEQVGFLVSKKLVSLDHVYQLLPVTQWWEKLKPIVEGMRKQWNMPEAYSWFEYLYNEFKKRE